MGPKENPKDKAARRREQRIAKLERRSSAEEQASGLTSDLRAVYGLMGMTPSNTAPIGPMSGGKKMPSMFALPTGSGPK